MISEETHRVLRVEQLPGGYTVEMSIYGRGYSVEKAVYRNLGDVLEAAISFLAHRDEDRGDRP